MLSVCPLQLTMFTVLSKHLLAMLSCVLLFFFWSCFSFVVLNFVHGFVSVSSIKHHTAFTSVLNKHFTKHFIFQLVQATKRILIMHFYTFYRNKSTICSCWCVLLQYFYWTRMKRSSCYCVTVFTFSQHGLLCLREKATFQGWRVEFTFTC